MHIQIYNEIRNKKTLYFTFHIQKLHFRNTKETYATQQEGCPSINEKYKSLNYTARTQWSVWSADLSTISNSRTVIGPDHSYGDLVGLRLCWHLLSPAGKTWLSIPSLVIVGKFRCLFFVARSAYPSFWGLTQTDHSGHGLFVQLGITVDRTERWSNTYMICGLMIRYVQYPFVS